MTVKNVHTLYAVVHDSTAIGGVHALNIDPKDQVLAEATAGEPWARFTALVGQEPESTFSTYAINAALDLIGLTGSNIGDLTNGLIFHAQKKLAGGVRGGAGTHRKMVVNDGLVVPQTLSVSHRGNASLTYRVVTIYDGSNDPIVLTESQNLPAAPNDLTRFTLGQTTIANVTIDQKLQLDIDFGIELDIEAADSDLWPTHVGIKAINPKLTFRGTDGEWFKAGNIPLIGKVGTHANSISYLRKRSQTGFVADATVEHIKFTVDGYAHLGPIFDAQGNETAETGLIFETEYDGTNNPITIDTTSAIT